MRYAAPGWTPPGSSPALNSGGAGRPRPRQQWGRGVRGGGQPPLPGGVDDLGNPRAGTPFVPPRGATVQDGRTPPVLGGLPLPPQPPIFQAPGGPPSGWPDPLPVKPGPPGLAAPSHLGDPVMQAIVAALLLAPQPERRGMFQLI